MVESLSTFLRTAWTIRYIWYTANLQTMTTRKAILIGYPGEGNGRLPGVGKDLSNMYRYLQTPRGGGWRREEITVLRGPESAELLQEVALCSADYLLVYFSGHGMAEPVVEWTGEIAVYRWLLINGEELFQDLQLLNSQAARQIVICDCCRTRPGATIGGIPETLEEWSFTVEEFYAAREAFDEYIHLSPPGAVIVHGAQDGRPSYDSKDGGRFTLALLGGALDWRTGSAWSPIPIGWLVDYAGAVLGDARRAQVPEIVYQDGDLRVPFGLDTPWPLEGVVEDDVPETLDRRLVQPAPLPDPARTWLVLGGLVVGALWLGSRG